MAAADVVIAGTVLTVDEKRPTAPALAVAGFVGPGSAQTIDTAWQLFAGSLEVGKYTGMVVLSADSRTVPPEQIADLDLRAAFLAGRQVYRQ
jgi:predicted amidohydrolase YtcJ